VSKNLTISIESVHEGSTLEPGQRFSSHAAEVLIGRSSSADIVLKDPSVSGRHVIVEATDEGFRIRNLSRRGATFVEGERLAPEEERHVSTSIYWL